MAGETTLSDLVSNGGRSARIVAQAVHTVLYDPTGARQFLTQYGEGAPGSATLGVTKVTRGLAMAAASSETSGGASNTALTTGNFDLTVARYLAKMQPTDLFKLTANGGIDVDYLVGLLAESLELTITDLCAALFANVSGGVGTSGADMTVDDFLDAYYTLNLANNAGRIVAMLHGQQVNDLTDSLFGLGGAIQMRQDVQEGLAMMGPGFKGTLLGVSVIQSDSCPLANANADRRGCMFSQGAFAYRFGSVDLGLMVDPADIVFATPEMFVEKVRDGANAMTTLIVNSYPAVAEAEDARAVRIVTDA